MATPTQQYPTNEQMGTRMNRHRTRTHHTLLLTTGPLVVAQCRERMNLLRIPRRRVQNSRPAQYHRRGGTTSVEIRPRTHFERGLLHVDDSQPSVKSDHAPRPDAPVSAQPRQHARGVPSHRVRRVPTEWPTLLAKAGRPGQYDYVDLLDQIDGHADVQKTKRNGTRIDTRQDAP